MSAVDDPVVVGIDGSESALAAVRWATNEAVARIVPLRIVCAYHWMVRYAPVPMFSVLKLTDREQHRDVAERLIADAVLCAQQVDASVKVEGVAVDGTATQVLVTESKSASMIVLGSATLSGHEFSVLGSVSAHVIARSSCPAVLVRGDHAAQGAVVAAVDGTAAGQHVLAFAFAYASQHGVPVIALLSWRLDLPKLLTWRSELSQPPMAARAQSWLSEALAEWRQKYPDVEVVEKTVEDQPIEALVRAGVGQRLIVVGRHGHLATVDTLLGSVSQGVLHHASCPVAVLPPSTDPR